MTEKIEISKDDIKKTVYFISNLTQMQNGKPMQGALSSKGDYMGGIFDRWINIVPESVLFNKVILPNLKLEENVEVITDYYDYDPKDVGIAPDVIGVKYGDKAIPFVIFDNGWKKVDGCPQIEVKTFKENQKMVSLRNQNYDNKFLVLAETRFRVDYLVPLINAEFYDDAIFESLHMDDEVFIKCNDEGKIKQSRKVDTTNELIGTVDLLKITSAESFMKIATKCGPKVSVEYLSGTEEYSGRPIKESLGPLLNYGSVQKSGLFRLSDSWYSFVGKDKKLLRDKNSLKTLDFYVEKPEDVEVLKILKSKLVIKVNRDCIFEDKKLECGKLYNIKLTQMDRGAGEEYFVLKTAIPYLKDQKGKLLEDLKSAILS